MTFLVFSLSFVIQIETNEYGHQYEAGYVKIIVIQIETNEYGHQYEAGYVKISKIG